MADPFIGEIRAFPYTFAPYGWATCDGQILQIQQNTALFAVIGATYGGNGTTNFALPNLRGRMPLQQGQGTSLSSYTLAQSGGTEQATLNESQSPAHRHLVRASAGTGSQTDPNGMVWAAGGASRGLKMYAASPMNPASMNPLAFATAGNGPQPSHNNMMPCLPLTFIIALQGVFPPRA